MAHIQEGVLTLFNPSPNSSFSSRGLLKKAASGVLAIFPCSRTQRTLRAKKTAAALLDQLF